MKKEHALLILIFIVAIFLRVYRLGDFPVGFHTDEAFLGYNAYSIFLTGKDMSGNFLPLHLKSFLFSPAAYPYFSIPFIALFGLDPFSVRFASAFFGSLTIIITYFLTKELFCSFSTKKIYKIEFIALVSSLLVAISPWHINLSRTATENTVVVFFISIGVLFYLQWIQKRKVYLLCFSFLAFALSIITYQAARSFLPLFIPALFIFSVLFKKKRMDIVIAFLGFLVAVLIPLFLILASRDLTLRLRTVSIFSTPEGQLVLNDNILTDGTLNIPPVVTRVFHNKVIIYSQEFLKNYFSHFSYQFLFADKGLPARYHIPLVGLLYFFELPFLLFGLYSIISRQRRLGLFLVGWIMLSVVGSGLTFDDIPNLQRTLIIFPAISIIVAYGLVVFFSLSSISTSIKKLLGILVIAWIIYNVAFYLHQYYVHAPVYRSWYRQDGYKELVAKVNVLFPKYRKIVVTTREASPTIFFLLYSRYDPLSFQKETINSPMHDLDRISFGKYEFSQEECPLRTETKNGKIITTGEKDVLYVNSGLCPVQTNIKYLGTIRRKDNSVAFRIAQLQ